MKTGRVQYTESTSTHIKVGEKATHLEKKGEFYYDKNGKQYEELDLLALALKKIKDKK